MNPPKASLNRNRFVERSFQTGTEDAQRQAIALAQIVDADFLERFIAHISAVNEFGGEIYISAARHKFNGDGKPVEHREVGAYETIGYILHYSSRSQVRGQVHEPDTPLTVAEPPEVEPAPEIEQNGAEPEPVAAGAE